MSYIAKRHCPKTCEYCGKAAEPYQVLEKCFAGSRVWYRGFHSVCRLKDTYGKDLQDQMNDHANLFLKMIRPADPDKFAGGFYHLPVPLRY